MGWRLFLLLVFALIPGVGDAQTTTEWLVVVVETRPYPPVAITRPTLRVVDTSRGYPCSYMIYSDAFDGLPADARAAIYHRMWEVLSGQETAPKYDRLTPPDRRAVLEILRDTKPALPDYFRASP